jgi:hypothetical protein
MPPKSVLLWTMATPLLVQFERKDVGDTEALAGNDEQIARPDRHIGDRRVMDDDLGGGPRQPQQLGLVAFNDEIFRGLKPALLLPSPRRAPTCRTVRFCEEVAPPDAICSRHGSFGRRKFSVQIVKKCKRASIRSPVRG